MGYAYVHSGEILERFRSVSVRGYFLEDIECNVVLNLSAVGNRLLCYCNVIVNKNKV